LSGLGLGPRDPKMEPSRSYIQCERESFNDTNLVTISSIIGDIGDRWIGINPPIYSKS
jgi:hypothetical protein